MKTVFNNSEIMHVWANKQTQTGKNPGRSIFFEADKIYSYGYHFCMANRINGLIGDIYLINSRSYSNTTSKHLSSLRMAISGEKVFCPYPEQITAEIISGKNKNFEYWYNECQGHVKKLINARKPEKYLNALYNIKIQAERFAAATNLDIPESLTQLLNTSDTKEAKKIIEDAANKYKKQEEERKRKTYLSELEQIKKFYKYETDRTYSRPLNDLLRISKDGTQIETTQGVKLPATLLTKYWNKLKENSLQIGEEIGGYTFKGYQQGKKVIEVGCHLINIKHINAILSRC